MRLYSWNVNGIRAVWNKGMLQEFIEQHDPDILCLQETKANEDQSPAADLDGYHQVWHDGLRKGYSGTAILSKHKPVSVIKGFPDEIKAKYDFKDQYGNTSEEGRLLSVEFEDFYLVTVYTPNSKGDLGRLSMRRDNWDPAFKDHSQALAKTKPVLMCGDFNVAHNEIDLARPKQNIGKHGFTDEERSGFTKLLGEGFVDTFRLLHPDATDVYSWWTAWGGARDRNVGWRIDYWLASESLAGAIIDAQVHADAYGSDHCPVSLEISL